MNDMLQFESKNVVSVRCKFGVIYCKKGQKSEDEMLLNGRTYPLSHTHNWLTLSTTSIDEGSAEFEEFLNILGDKIELDGWQDYNGGLATTGR